MQKEMDKAGIRIKFAKKFLELEKKKNPKLDDAAANEAATNRFLGTMWLINSDAPQFVTDNLMQAHISGNNNYPESVERAFAMVSAFEGAPGDTRCSATSLVQGTVAYTGRDRGGGGRGGPRRGAGRGGD